ncbi:MAG: CrcB family protein [Muribaculaceae bacterium]|nr:CrcB family protein [Muribaculaceae bacterium]
MSPHVLEFALVGLGGAIGAMSRHGVTYLGVFDDNPYYYTVAINLSGCLIIGIFTAFFLHYDFSRLWSLFFSVGVLGGYTTYSSFTRDAIELVEKGDMGTALLYIAITMVGGLGACFLGLVGTQHLLK